MQKAADALRTIGEVARLIGVQPHVLRYWETQFSQLSPVKRPDGRRYYRLDDLYLAAGLVELLREEGMTTRGAQRQLARDKGAALRERGRARLPADFGGAAPKAEAAAPKTRKARATGAPASHEAGAPASDGSAVTPQDDPAPAVNRADPDRPGTVSRAPSQKDGSDGALVPSARGATPATGSGIQPHDPLPQDGVTAPTARHDSAEVPAETSPAPDAAANLARLRALTRRLRAQPPQGLAQAARQRDALAAILSSRD